MPGGGATISTNQKREIPAAPGPPFPSNSARNGLSVDSSGIIVFGQEFGDMTNPAILLDERQVPMAGFLIGFTEMGANARAGIFFQADVAKPLATPFFQFNDELGDEIGRINFLSDIDAAGDGGSVYIGRHAGIADTFPNGNNVGIGWRTLEAMAGGFANTGVGYENMTLLTIGTNNTSMGASVFNNLLDGEFNASFGDSSGFNLVSGIGNSFFGSNAAQGFYGNSTSNVVFGSSANMIGAPSPVVNDNSILGAFSFVDGGSQFGDRNIIIGAHNNQHAGIITDDNIIIGNNNQVDTISNTLILGSGKIVSGVSNVVILGDNTQNTLLGQPAVSPIDDGINKLQVNGNIISYGSSDASFVQLIEGDAIASNNDWSDRRVGFTSANSTSPNDSAFFGGGVDGSLENVGLAIFQSALTTLESGIMFNQTGNLSFFVDTTISAVTDNGAAFQFYGDITTNPPIVGSAGRWLLGEFEAGAVVATGGIRVNIGGTDYKIPAIAA